MDGKLLARIGAVVFVAIAITATATEMTRKEEEPPVQTVQPGEDTSADPLRAAQRRCQLLGEAAARDPECLRTWAATRDRFLGVAPAPAETPPPHDGGR
jgi:conjugative transfer region protein TrbK